MREPFTYLPNWVLEPGVTTAYEQSLLLNLNYFLGKNDQAWPSHQTLSSRCGISIATVKRVLLQLREKGLIHWEKQSDQRGAKATNRYSLNLHKPSVDPIAHSEPSSVDGIAHTDPSIAQTELPHSSQGATPSLTQSYKQEPINKNQRTNTPLTPHGGEDLDRVDMGPAANGWRSPEPEPEPPAKGKKKRAGKFHPQPHDVSPELQPVTDALIDCWVNHLQGQKTHASWAICLTECKKILQDPGGGLAELKKQFAEAKQAKLVSRRKGWDGINYQRWQRFAGTPSRGSHGTHRPEPVNRPGVRLDYSENY